LNIKNELNFFKEQSLWKGGYFEGDPLNPNAISSYDEMGLGKIDEAGLGKISVLHATYLHCIKPYIKNSIALEIGPGRGGWTRCLLPAKEVWCLDAYSAEYNKFFEYVGKQSHVQYHVVEDFSFSKLPEKHFNYVFSFGCLCHISFEGIYEYAKNMYNKLITGANCFWMVADYKKYNTAVKKPVLDLNQPDDLVPGRWFNTYDRVIKALSDLNYTIVATDVGTCLRDPIIHFRK
jgi:hypothetical protein